MSIEANGQSGGGGVASLVEAMPIPLVVFATDGRKLAQSPQWSDWCQAVDGVSASGDRNPGDSSRVEREIAAQLANRLNVGSSETQVTFVVLGRQLVLRRLTLQESSIAVIHPPTPVVSNGAGLGSAESEGEFGGVDAESVSRASVFGGGDHGALRDAYRQTLEIAVQAFRLRLWGFDPQTGKGWYSPQFGELHESEFQEWEISLKGWLGVIHPEDQAAIPSRLRGLIERNEPYDIEFRLNLNGEGYRWHRSCAGAFRDNGGKVIVVGAIQDIDDERRREAALRVEEDRLWALADHAPMLIGIVNRNEGLHYANRVWCRIAGVGIEGLRGDGWLEHIDPDDRASLARLPEAPTESSGLFRFVVRAANGRRHQMVAGVSVLPGKHSETPDIAIMATDVTTHLESVERLSLALDAADAGMWDWRVERNTFGSTERLYTMLGEDGVRGEQPLQWFVDRLHPEEQASVLANIERSRLDDSKEYDQEFRMRHADGGYRWIRSRGRVVERDATGRAVRMIGLHIDVTNKKQAEQALQEALTEASEKELRISDILKDAPASIAIFDRQMCFLATSERWLEDYDLGGQSIIGRCVYDVMEVPDRWRGVHQRCLAGASEECDEDHWVRPNGEAKWQRWKVRPWLDVTQSTISGIMIFSEDITDRKRAEAELARHTEQLACESRASLADQIGIQISHELRHPIAELINQAFVLKKSLTNELGREHSAVQGVKELKGVAMRINELLDNLRTFTARRPPRHQKIEVGELIRGVLPLVGVRARSAGVAIESSTEGPAVWTTGDVIQLQQVLVNVVVNAIESIEASGEVDGRVQICAKIPDMTHVRITVIDSGPGIRAEDIERAFDRFYTTKSEGLGVGLSICRGIVEAHGGAIYFNSSRPSTLNIELPVAAGEQKHEQGNDPHRR